MSSENMTAVEVRNDKPFESWKIPFTPKDDADEISRYFGNKIREFKKNGSKRSKDTGFCPRLSKNIHEENDAKLTERTVEIPAKRLKKSAYEGTHEFDDSHSDKREKTEKHTKVDDKGEPKKPSKRQMKKLKAEQREKEKKEANKLQTAQKALTYISKWKHARNEWKFIKARQIWLMENILDETLIPDAVFPTVLEYFEGCKGMARRRLLEKGMNAIRKVEDDEENGEKDARSIAYERARELLQTLPTDA